MRFCNDSQNRRTFMIYQNTQWFKFIHRVYEKTVSLLFLNNFVNHWPILIIFGPQNYETTLRRGLYFNSLILVMSIHYLVRCRSRSLAIYNRKFILASACIGSKNHWDHKIIENRLHIQFYWYLFYIVRRRTEMMHLGQQLLNTLLASGANVHWLRSCWKKTFWAHAVIKIMWCDTCDCFRDNNCYLCLLLFICWRLYAMLLVYIGRARGSAPSRPGVAGTSSKVARRDGLLSGARQPHTSLCVNAVSTWRSLSRAMEPLHLRLLGYWTSRTRLHAAYATLFCVRFRKTGLTRQTHL